MKLTNKFLVVLMASICGGTAWADTPLSGTDFEYKNVPEPDGNNAGGLDAAWDGATNEFTFDGAAGYNDAGGRTDRSFFHIFHVPHPANRDWSNVTGLRFDVTVETTNIGSAADIADPLVTIFDPNGALNASPPVDDTYQRPLCLAEAADGNESSYQPGLRFYAQLNNGDVRSWSTVLDVTKAGGSTTEGDYPITTYTFEMNFDNVQDPKLLPDNSYQWCQQNGNLITTSASIARRHHDPSVYPLTGASEYGQTFARDDVESLRIGTFFRAGRWIGSDERITATIDNITLLGGSINSVPTVSEWGLVIMTLLVCTVGTGRILQAVGRLRLRH